MHTLKKCEWCNTVRHLTTHHIKNRIGEKESVYIKGKLIEHTMRVCRPCHDEIERMYEFETRVVLHDPFKRENTLSGIRNNLYLRMADLDEQHKIDKAEYWLKKKMYVLHGRMHHDKSCRLGLYYTKERSKRPYRMLIMTIGIALNDIKVINSRKVT